MKQPLLLPIALLICILVNISCNKNESLTGSPAAGADFIEFKMDGKQYKIVEFSSATESSVGVVSKYDSTNSGGVTVHNFSVHFLKALGSGDLSDILLAFYDSKSFAPGTIVYSQANGNLSAALMIALVENNNSYLPSDSTVFTLNITALKPSKGGKAKGTFNGANFYLMSGSTHNTLSSGHVLTEGKFSVTF